MDTPSNSEDHKEEATAALKEAKQAQKRIANKVTYWNQSAKDMQETKAANHFADLIRDVLFSSKN